MLVIGTGTPPREPVDLDAPVPALDEPRNER
jgi:hypothetical protein